jgi:hypothetical protein
VENPSRECVWRRLAACLCGVALAGALAGCSGDDDEAGGAGAGGSSAVDDGAAGGGGGGSGTSVGGAGADAGRGGNGSAGMTPSGGMGGDTDAGSAGTGGAGGSMSDAGSAGGGGSTITGPTSCDGIDCAGQGSCFLNQHGVAECECNECYFPTEDRRCVLAPVFCDEAIADGFSCNGSAQCGTPAVNFCTCELSGPLVPACVCPATKGQFYDGTDCVDDVRGCQDLTECSHPEDDKWLIEVTGDVSFTLIERQGYGSNWDWTNEYLKLYNDWPANVCGYAVLRGLALPAGTHDASQLQFTMGYDDQTWSTQNAGASGTVTVNRWQWCDTFDCNVVDIELDVTLASESGGTIHAMGFIRNDMF